MSKLTVKISTKCMHLQLEVTEVAVPREKLCLVQNQTEKHHLHLLFQIRKGQLKTLTPLIRDSQLNLQRTLFKLKLFLIVQSNLT